VNELEGWSLSVVPDRFAGSPMVVAIGMVLGLVLGLAMGSR
jgi:hypothetical protein